MSIKVENLTKYYGSQAAVKDISFEINTGEIVGFLGPNGAGKSTTLKMITTYLSPSSGKVFVDDLDISEKSLEVRKKIGYLPEQNPLYSDMNVLEYLEYAAELQSIPKTEIKDAVKKMVKVCGLIEVKHKDIGELSKGFKQRVGLAQAMIHNPELLLLDEPTSGLDPNQIAEIRKLIKDLGKHKTVMLSTHILQEVQVLCDRIIIINNGEIVADNTSEDLKSKFKTQFNVKVVIKRNPAIGKEKLVSELESINNVDKVKVDQEDDVWKVDILTSKDTDLREDIARKVMSMNLVMLELHQEETSLEDIFRNLTRKQ
ncbi:MAG TPA: ATP-binding cassette domain-containing protein [Ignavibacteria bacterium]